MKIVTKYDYALRYAQCVKWQNEVTLLLCSDDALKEDENVPKPWEEENGIYGIMVIT